MKNNQDVGVDVGSDIDAIARALENAEIPFSYDETLSGNVSIELENGITFDFDGDSKLMNVKEMA